MEGEKVDSSSSWHKSGNRSHTYLFCTRKVYSQKAGLSIFRKKFFKNCRIFNKTGRVKIWKGGISLSIFLFGRRSGGGVGKDFCYHKGLWEINRRKLWRVSERRT